MQIQSMFKVIITAFLLVLPNLGSAETILTVRKSEKSVSYTLEELLELPLTTVVTGNDYVDGATSFQGPRLRLVLDALNVDQSANLRMTALNDFSSDVPASDAFNYDVILAVYRDGEAMSVRDKGPIWLIYPMDDHPSLQDEDYNGRLVWQLKHILVE
jgi:hypothetical protein